MIIREKSLNFLPRINRSDSSFLLVHFFYFYKRTFSGKKRPGVQIPVPALAKVHALINFRDGNKLLIQDFS